MLIKTFQKGFNYSQDGPGNRLVYHMQGCNLHCPWCANPESMNINGTRMSGLSGPGGSGTTRLSCGEVSVGAIVEEAGRCESMFFDGGGVTFTGGEPTLQFDALMAALKGIKALGIHTAIETNGTHPGLEMLFPCIDFLMMDFKHYNSDLHRQVTGLGNENVTYNLAKALNMQKEVLVRIPLVNGFNTSREDAEGFAEFFKGLDTSRAAFELLPYHEYGRIKWQQCGMEYKMEDAFVKPGTLEVFEQVFKSSGLSVVRT